jgi:hypothetical protein
MSTETSALTRLQVEQMQAGKELDALVAEVFGFPLAPPCPLSHMVDGDEETGWCYTCQESIAEVAPEAAPYSTRIGCAWEVLCHLTDKGWLYTIDGGNKQSFTIIGIRLVEGMRVAVVKYTGAPSVEVAICRAGLIAVLDL